MKKRSDIQVLRFFLIICATVISVAASAASLPDFTKLVDDYGSAVVNISTKQKIDRGRRHWFNIPNLPEGHPFKHFFDDFGGRRSPRSESYAKSLGSGFIISDDGYILTNNHVVEGADEIIVSLKDRRELKAKVVGADPKTDVALIKVEATGLDEVKIGKSSKLKVGEWVLAIGSPFGFDQTVTAGIVSAKERNLPNGNYVPFIQTDVAINPGNSGGPLFNLKGEVVGINAQIFTRTGSYSGLSFAIPIDLAIDVADQLKNSGKVSRGWLGVLIQEVSRDLADSFGMERPYGAAVLDVTAGGPAEKAGIKVGDVIIEYDGKEVFESASLPPLVGATMVGDEVKVVVIRSGKKKTLKVTVGELKDEQAGLSTSSSAKGEATDLGLTVRDISEEEKSQSKLDGDGVLVTDVKEGIAMRAGVRRGDIIRMIGGKAVTSVADFKKILAAIESDKSISLLIQRRGRPMFLAIRTGQ